MNECPKVEDYVEPNPGHFPVPQPRRCRRPKKADLLNLLSWWTEAEYMATHPDERSPGG